MENSVDSIRVKELETALEELNRTVGESLSVISPAEKAVELLLAPWAYLEYSDSCDRWYVCDEEGREIQLEQAVIREPE